MNRTFANAVRPQNSIRVDHVKVLGNCMTALDPQKGWIEKLISHLLLQIQCCSYIHFAVRSKFNVPTAASQKT